MLLSKRLCFLSLFATGSELYRTGESGMMPSSCSGDEARWSSELKTTAAINLGTEILVLRKPQGTVKPLRFRQQAES